MVCEETSLVRRVRESAVGDGMVMDGPFGERPLVYADHTASGRVLAMVEDALRAQVMPWYANTHTEASATGRRTTRLREWARGVVLEAVGGGDGHAVIFCGSGATAAVDKLTRILATREAVVFVGPYEHHSNELPWREAGARVVRIAADRRGGIDVRDLAGQLAVHQGEPLLIGAFSAGSNVTGVCADVEGVSALLHRHGALACWDYAAAGPHVEIRVQDALFLSPHKFPGGPGTPGVLVVRRDLVTNPVPSVPGGGTIVYVHPEGRFYLDDPVHREEGGTPAILESIRAGLVLQLHRQVGPAAIRARERDFVRRAIDSWRGNRAIEILGDPDGDRLPIVSFTVHGPGGRLLHHNLVVALLDDLFGIQARGGCSCAGPYGHDLLRIGPARARELAAQAVAGYLGVKPGWARVSFAYYLSEEEFAYIVGAVHLIATYGARIQGEYRFDVYSGLWSHRTAADHTVAAPTLGAETPPYAVPNRDLSEFIATAAAKLRTAPEARAGEPGDVLPEPVERLRWFDLPAACVEAEVATG